MPEGKPSKLNPFLTLTTKPKKWCANTERLREIDGAKIKISLHALRFTRTRITQFWIVVSMIYMALLMFNQSMNIVLRSVLMF